MTVPIFVTMPNASKPSGSSAGRAILRFTPPKSNSSLPKYYVLEMLPYPSGALHMGHVRNYSIGDALARYMWMNGYNVLHPMGWDSFGLPAENAAIKNNTPPRQWTLSNIANMKAQMKRLGFAYDWSREVTTCLPDYYRWNQWFFLKLYEKGLAYRKKSKVNWCPKCATVLANEQVVGGFCWRHEDTLVEQRELEQWFLRTTKYADELLSGLDKLEGWPEKVRTMQRNWIGRSEGALVDFDLGGISRSRGFDHHRLHDPHRHDLRCDLDSTRARAPDRQRPRRQEFAAPRPGRSAHRRAAQSQRDRRHWRDREARCLYRALREESVQRQAIPIWVANYILMDYGTGAIMSVPAHDDRDYEFAKKYKLEVRLVILPADGDPEETAVEPQLPFTAHDGMLVNSGQFSGLNM